MSHKCKRFFLWLHINRDTALGVKADVDGLLTRFNSVEESFPDLKEKLENSLQVLDNLNKDLTKVGSVGTSNNG